MKKYVLLIFFQIFFIVVAQDKILNDENRDNSTNVETTTINSTTVPIMLENSTIPSSDNITTSTITIVKLNETALNETTTESDMLIPPATVEAQIEKLHQTSKKPSSRLQVILPAQ